MAIDFFLIDFLMDFITLYIIYVITANKFNDIGCRKFSFSGLNILGLNEELTSKNEMNETKNPIVYKWRLKKHKQLSALTIGICDIKKEKEKNAFCSHRAVLNFEYMPSGLSNGVSIFQESISVVLSWMVKYAPAYLDDILIFPATKEGLLSYIQNLFSQFREHKL